jgi:malonate transporter
VTYWLLPFKRYNGAENEMASFFAIMPLITLMVLGNILKRKSFYTEADIRALSKTLFWVILPALLYRSTFLSGREILKQKNLFSGTHLSYLLTLVLAWLLGTAFFHRGNAPRVASSVMASIRGNNVYLGLPLVSLTMGDKGLEAASVYFAVTSVGFQLLSIGAGDLALTRRIGLKGLWQTALRLVRNPQLLACAAGVITSLLGVENLPRVLDESLRILGSAASGTALLMIGAKLDLSSVGKAMVIFRETWWDALVRLVLHPMLMWFCLTALSVPAPLLQVTVLVSAMPVAVNVFVIATEMGMDGNYSADLVVATTLLASITIPFWIKILGVL